MEQNSNESKKLNRVYRILFVLLFGMVGIGTWYYIKQREKIEVKPKGSSNGVQRHGLSYKRIDTTVDVDFRKNTPLTSVEKGL